MGDRTPRGLTPAGVWQFPGQPHKTLIWHPNSRPGWETSWGPTTEKKTVAPTASAEARESERGLNKAKLRLKLGLGQKKLHQSKEDQQAAQA